MVAVPNHSAAECDGTCSRHTNERAGAQAQERRSDGYQQTAHGLRALGMTVLFRMPRVIVRADDATRSTWVHDGRWMHRPIGEWDLATDDEQHAIATAEPWCYCDQVGNGCDFCNGVRAVPSTLPNAPPGCTHNLPHDAIACFASDIPRDIAMRAHAGTSFVPETRGEQQITSYAATLGHDLEHLGKLATTDAKRSDLRSAFARYRRGYRERTIAYLVAHGRCLSTMITGGSNFPVRSQAKKNASADKRTEDVIDYRENALAKIRKLLTPELQPIRASDENAVERYEGKIAKAERLQAHMIATNKTIRAHAKDGADAQIAALVAMGHPESIARKLLAPDFCGRIGYADYEIKNNGANLRRMKARTESVAATQAAPVVEETGAHARFEDSPPENRVRLYFPGKPDAATRTRLKGHGFRWTPSLGCWQAYRNHTAITFAKREAGCGE